MRVQQGLGNKHPRPPTPHNFELILHTTCRFVTPYSARQARFPTNWQWYCPAFLACCILIGWEVSSGRYEDANATGGGAELVEGTVKPTPTCMNRRDTLIVPDRGGSV